MKASEIIKCTYPIAVRNRKEDHIKGTPWQYDVKEIFTGKSRGWVVMDMLTIQALKVCYEALSEESKAKFDRMHINTLVNFAWKHVKLGA